MFPFQDLPRDVRHHIYSLLHPPARSAPDVAKRDAAMRDGRHALLALRLVSRRERDNVDAWPAAWTVLRLAVHRAAKDDDAAALSRVAGLRTLRPMLADALLISSMASPAVVAVAEAHVSGAPDKRWLRLGIFPDLVVLRLATCGAVRHLAAALAEEPFRASCMCNAPVRMAAMGGHAATLRLLLAQPDVDPTVFGGEAMTAAALHGHGDAVAVLLADPRIAADVQARHAAAQAADVRGYADLASGLRAKRARVA